MWREYFGSGARIIGLDINPECKKHEQDSIEIFIGSQDDPAIIKQILNKYPKIDIVLDDESHINKHMVSTFEILYEAHKSQGRLHGRRRAHLLLGRLWRWTTET
jgi:cephalosporin hydroxylase